MGKAISICVILTLLASVSWSQESSPTRPAESKTDAAASDNQKGSPFQQAPAPFPLWFIEKPIAPVVNVFTNKHAGEKSECTEPKDWKEWGASAWCRSLEWIDTDRVIAVFTVILGSATVFLFLATRSLVKGADKTAEYQLRAYISVTPRLALNWRHKN